MCEKNSSVNLRFAIFVVAFRARKLFGTFEKRAPDLLVGTEQQLRLEFVAVMCGRRFMKAITKNIPNKKLNR